MASVQGLLWPFAFLPAQCFCPHGSCSLPFGLHFFGGLVWRWSRAMPANIGAYLIAPLAHGCCSIAIGLLVRYAICLERIAFAGGRRRTGSISRCWQPTMLVVRLRIVHLSSDLSGRRAASMLPSPDALSSDLPFLVLVCADAIDDHRGYAACSDLVVPDDVSTLFSGSSPTALADIGQGRRPPIWRHFSVFHPFLGSTLTPFGKGLSYLRAFRCKDVRGPGGHSTQGS